MVNPKGRQSATHNPNVGGLRYEKFDILVTKIYILDICTKIIFKKKKNSEQYSNRWATFVEGVLNGHGKGHIVGRRVS